MNEEKKMICPECDGQKTISGTCVCDSEWRGTQVGSEWTDCQCMPEVECPKCHGTGYVTPAKTCHD